MKIYQAVQKLLVEDAQTERHTGDFISLLSFLEGRVKVKNIIFATGIQLKVFRTHPSGVCEHLETQDEQMDLRARGWQHELQDEKCVRSAGN
jgi:hypothetical protein